MGTIEGWKAEEIYDVAHGNARHGDRHTAGLLAVAAEAERRGRETAFEAVTSEAAASAGRAAAGDPYQSAPLFRRGLATAVDVARQMLTTTPEPTR